jgi:hypothetical protein
MRYIGYGLAIFAAGFTLAFASGYLPRDATASHRTTNDSMNVLGSEATTKSKTLPRQDLRDEVYR